MTRPSEFRLSGIALPVGHPSTRAFNDRYERQKVIRLMRHFYYQIAVPRSEQSIRIAVASRLHDRDLLSISTAFRSRSFGKSDDVAYRRACSMTSQLLTMATQLLVPLLKVVCLPFPIHRSPIKGISITPINGSSPRSNPIKVPKRGLPMIRLLVPSIGSRIHV